MFDATLFSPDVPVVVWALLGAMLLFMGAIGAIMWPRLWRVCHQAGVDDASPLPAEGYPSVSVVVYAQSAGSNLRLLLPQILQQDYPAPMEVIVVNDETDDDTENIVSELELHYPNLYMTFTPDRSRSLSRRKLSITLGVKAARFGVVMLTDGNCRVSSPLWLRRMMRHIAAGSEVVIGYTELREADDAEPLARRFSWDRTWESVRWLSAAIAGHPLRGTACNLAYTRKLFFDHKGFSRTLHLKYGDDDAFISEITSRAATAVELSEESRTILIEPAPNEMAPIERRRRDFTAQLLPRGAYRAMGLTSALWWLWAICGIAATLCGLPSLIPAAISLVLAITFCLIHMSQWRRTSVALGDRPLFWTVPWMAWVRPIRTLFARLSARSKRRDNLTHII